ncbi:hypothetical protein GCM10027093_62280 [Paraburkholderia jirisanensis]
MAVDWSKRYADADDYFSLHGNVVMKLTTQAAIAVCEQAAKRGLLVVRIEGGIWHSHGFEARVDCIWDGADPPIDIDAAHKNNLEAIQFILSEPSEYDTFIVTSPPITGWEK